MTSQTDGERARFKALEEATAADWVVVDRAEARYHRNGGPATGLLALLASMEHADAVGFPVNLYTHCLQSATRVLEGGIDDDELVVVALFHDVPEAVSDNDHGWLAAQMLSPWISPRRAWLLTHHGEFQSKHFANHPVRDPHDRDKHIGHPWYEETAYFCAQYDQNCFDPDFRTPPLKDFEPLVRRFFIAAKARGKDASESGAT